MAFSQAVIDAVEKEWRQQVRSMNIRLIQSRTIAAKRIIRPLSFLLTFGQSTRHRVHCGICRLHTSPPFARKALHTNRSMIKLSTAFSKLQENEKALFWITAFCDATKKKIFIELLRLSLFVYANQISSCATGCGQLLNFAKNNNTGICFLLVIGKSDSCLFFLNFYGNVKNNAAVSSSCHGRGECPS